MRIFDPRKLKKGDIAYTILFSLIGVYFVYSFSFGVASGIGQFDIWMEYVDNVELECEMIVDVPNNYYTGRIDFSTMKPIVTILGNFMNIDQQELIKSILMDKISETPCYKEHLLYAD